MTQREEMKWHHHYAPIGNPLFHSDRACADQSCWIKDLPQAQCIETCRDHNHDGCLQLSDLQITKWHKFDPSDETTWPEEGALVWVAWYFTADKEWCVDHVNWAPDRLSGLLSIDVWQPIPIPSPPPSDGEE